jgi:hypothetical protein
VLHDQLSELGVPILGGLPIGHGPHPLTVPLGTMATLDTMAGTLTSPASANYLGACDRHATYQKNARRSPLAVWWRGCLNRRDGDCTAKWANSTRATRAPGSDPPTRTQQLAHNASRSG